MRVGPRIGLRASPAIGRSSAPTPALVPHPEQPASWTGLCPGNHESAGKRHHGKRRKGNQHLQPWLVACAWAAVRTDGYLRSFYRRTGPQVRRLRQPPGQEESNQAVAHKLITIVWHVLTTGRPYQDLGADYFTSRLDPEIETRRLVAKLQAQGYTVTLEPAA